jgi:lysine N6-hydroxylase
VSARVHDVVAVGAGPFNLGLAALAAPLDDLDLVVLEGREDFSWHPGMMLEGATIQVPFLADLVSMADPTSSFSFLAHLKETGRLYPFYIRESFYPLREEYDAYCRWAAHRLPSVRFGHTVEQVVHDEHDDVFVVHARLADGERVQVRGRHLVLGTGTEPVVPPAARGLGGPVVHSAGYLSHKARLQARDSVTVVGSGQSAAEIYLDLLEDVHELGYRLDWITRSPRFFPMEYTKLTLEMTSPEYVDYYHGLEQAQRDRLGREQRSLYKGISGDLVDTVFDTLYRKSVRGPVPTRLLTGCELADAAWDDAAGEYRLGWHHVEQGRDFCTTTEGLVLATGYAPRVPAFLDPVRHLVRWDEQGRYAVARDYTVDHAGARIWVQNAEEHTHGLTAPDLGMGAYRNSVILRGLTGREVYPVERRIAFQQFGALDDVADVDVRGTARAGLEVAR